MPFPEIKSSILLLTKGTPSLPVRQLLDFVKLQGRKYVKE
jgi:hypothetical protein